MVDFSVFRRFVSHAIKCSDEPALALMAGVHAAAVPQPVGIAAVTSASLGQELQFVSRHAKLIFRGMEFQVDTGPRWSTLQVKPMRPLVETHVFVMQSLLARTAAWSKRSWAVQEALDHARNNLAGPLGVEELAEVAHLSPRQLSRVFTAETGQSPAKAIEGLRLERPG